MTGSFDIVRDAVLCWLSEGLSTPFVLGVSGAQGSGKSTLAAQLTEALQNIGLRAAMLSLDDLYYPRSVRLALSLQIHPLLVSRGVPGTHDIQLGLHLLDTFRSGRGISLPRFDKSIDDRLPFEDWAHHPDGLDMLILEGWCLGARAQTESELSKPINKLESDEDPDGIWRAYVNTCLANGYRDLFKAIDRLIFLSAPDMETVKLWRWQQEEDLAAKIGQKDLGTALMSQPEIGRFVAHFERLTRANIKNLPAQSDLTLDLNVHRQVIACRPERPFLVHAEKLA